VPIERRFLEHQADRGAHLDRRFCDVEAGDARRAGARPHEGREHVHRGGLARAVRAEQAEELAWRDLEVEAVDRGELAVALGQPARAPRRWSRRRRLAARSCRSFLFGESCARSRHPVEQNRLVSTLTVPSRARAVTSTIRL
jgi:hypothetical protein